MCILTDFRELNKCIERETFPLPKISDLPLKLERFAHATATDLSQGYCHVLLDEESQKLCATTLPWGPCRHLSLPMGLANAPDIFQAAMARCLDGLDCARAHIDDVLVTSTGSCEDHLKKVEEVIKRLHDFRFRINLKSRALL